MSKKMFWDRTENKLKYKVRKLTADVDLTTVLCVLDIAGSVDCSEPH